jgi:hypothetical protein
MDYTSPGRLFSAVKPSSQRRLRFTRAPPREKAIDADVLIQFGPVDAFALADESPLDSLLRRAVGEPRVPDQGNRDRAAIDEVNYQGVLGQRHALCP